MLVRVSYMLTPRKRELATPKSAGLSELTRARPPIYRAEVRLQFLPPLTPLLMPTHDPAQSATTDGLTVSPALDLLAESEQIPQQQVLVDLRVLRLCALSIIIGLAGAVASRLLIGLISFITNFAFYQRFSFEEAVPGDAVARLGLWVIPI